jgi:hypothetical protein
MTGDRTGQQQRPNIINALWDDENLSPGPGKSHDKPWREKGSLLGQISRHSLHGRSLVRLLYDSHDFPVICTLAQPSPSTSKKSVLELSDAMQLPSTGHDMFVWTNF